MKDTSLYILGLYTIIYVIVFIIQKSQMSKQKEVIASMKSFMDIFKINEVKEYVKMKEETMTEKAVQMINDDQQIKKVMESVMNPLKDQMKESFDAGYIELLDFSINELKKRDDIDNLLNSKLPINKDFILTQMNRSSHKNP